MKFVLRAVFPAIAGGSAWSFFGNRESRLQVSCPSATPTPMIAEAPKPTLIQVPAKGASAPTPPRRQWLGYPCWLISLVAHAAVFVACGFLLGNMPRGGSLL